jgi:HK97 family phage prohead protease
MITCPECGTPCNVGEMTCPVCGADLTEYQGLSEEMALGLGQQEPGAEGLNANRPVNGKTSANLGIEARGKRRREARYGTFEVRADGAGFTFDGIASRVDRPYMVSDAFGEFEETMGKGAFNRTLAQKADVRLLVNHTGVPLARTKSQTLTLTTTPDLRAVAPLDPANPTVQEIRSAMGRGDLDQMSVGFRVKDQSWSKDYAERTIKEVELFDVSIVTYPASATTTASLRAIDDVLNAFPDGVEWDEAEVRRAIRHLASLIGKPVTTTRSTREPNPNAALRRALWGKRLSAA